MLVLSLREGTPLRPLVSAGLSPHEYELVAGPRGGHHHGDIDLIPVCDALPHLNCLCTQITPCENHRLSSEKMNFIGGAGLHKFFTSSSKLAGKLLSNRSSF